MQEEERLKLRKIYKESSDEALIEMLLEDKEAYQEGVYELLWEEAKKRGIESRVDEIKKNKEKKNEERKKNWVTVYNFFDILDGQVLEMRLKEHNIPVMNVSHQDTAYDGLFKSSIGEGVLRVREDYVEEAKRIVADFEKERQKKNE